MYKGSFFITSATKVNHYQQGLCTLETRYTLMSCQDILQLTMHEQFLVELSLHSDCVEMPHLPGWKSNNTLQVAKYEAEVHLGVQECTGCANPEISEPDSVAMAQSKCILQASQMLNYIHADFPYHESIGKEH